MPWPRYQSAYYDPYYYDDEEETLRRCDCCRKLFRSHSSLTCSDCKTNQYYEQVYGFPGPWEACEEF